MVNMKTGDGMEIISKKSMKVFHDLSNREQNDIRRSYKDKCSREYKYSIHLYILYVILGILAILGMIVSFFDFLLGMIIFTLSFIFMIIDIYFLNKSNANFYRYLKSIGYVYDNKMKKR